MSAAREFQRVPLGDGLTWMPEFRALMSARAPVSLTRREAAIFERLREARGFPVSMERLLVAVYGSDPEGGPLTAQRCVWMFLFHLRRKLRPLGLRIRTYHALGYVLEVPPCA